MGLVRSAWGTDKLTVREKFKKRGNIFLEVDSGYYRLRLYLKKETQTQAYRVRKIYLANNNDKPISLAETNLKHYNKIVKKLIESITIWIKVICLLLLMKISSARKSKNF